MMNKMFITKNIVGFLALAIFLLSSPVLANTSPVATNAERVVLLQQIKQLLAEVVKLQALLEKQNLATKGNATNYTPYETVFFKRAVETIYLVEGGQLLSTNGSSVRRVDKQLFDFFAAVVGSDVVTKEIKEWRIFYDDKSDLGAFVETVSGSGKWLVGVNRYSYSSDNLQIKKSFANLFVHEYSHILLFQEQVFTEDFTNKFWTKEDFGHQKRVSGVPDSERFNALRHYFDNNKDRFVSDYATISPDEDMAETFVSFVKEDKPFGYTLAERKILAFYEESQFVDLRAQLRTNLQTLKVL